MSQKPPSYAAQKRLIQLTEEQMAKHAQERVAKIQAHLNELADINSEREKALSSIVAAAVQRDGADAVQLGACLSLAEAVASINHGRRWASVKALLKDLSIHEAPPHMVWAAKQAGVTLFDEPAPEEPRIIEPTAAELPKLVQE